MKFAYQREGVGTRLQRVIHAGLDAVPMPAATRIAIKNCGGCARREHFLNEMEKRARQLFGDKSTKS